MSLVSDVIKSANIKLAASVNKLAADTTPENFGAFPYIGVDTKTVPDIGSALKGDSKEYPIRVSPASMAWRGALTGALPPGISDSLNAKLNDSVDPVMHGRPGNPSSVGIMGHVQPEFVPAPGLPTEEAVYNQLFSRTGQREHNLAEKALKSNLDAMLNSQNSREMFRRNAVQEYLKPPILINEVPENMRARWNSLYSGAKSQGSRVSGKAEAAALKRMDLSRLYGNMKSLAEGQDNERSALNAQYSNEINALIDILNRR